MSDEGSFYVIGGTGVPWPVITPIPESLQPNVVSTQTPEVVATNPSLFMVGQQVSATVIGVQANTQDAGLLQTLGGLLNQAIGNILRQPNSAQEWQTIIQDPLKKVVTAQLLRGFQAMAQISPEWIYYYHFVASALEPPDGPQTDEDRYFLAHTQFAKSLHNQTGSPPSLPNELSSSHNEAPDYLPDDFEIEDGQLPPAKAGDL